MIGSKYMQAVTASQSVERPTNVMQAEDLPVAPANLPGSMTNSMTSTVPHTPRNVRIRTSSEALGSLGGTPRQDSRDGSESSFSSSRRSVMAARVKRSSSVLLGA